jgi:hypothetical protein
VRENQSFGDRAAKQRKTATGDSLPAHKTENRELATDNWFLLTRVRENVFGDTRNKTSS